MEAAIRFIRTGEKPEEVPVKEEPKAKPEVKKEESSVNVSFEDLGKEEPKVVE